MNLYIVNQILSSINVSKNEKPRMKLYSACKYFDFALGKMYKKKKKITRKKLQNIILLQLQWSLIFFILQTREKEENQPSFKFYRMETMRVLASKMESKL